jgi:hypothetical protein
MKRLSLLAAVLLIAACSSSSSGQKGDVADIAIDQTAGPSELNYPSGPIDVKYEIHITNRLATPVTLRRITFRTANPPGGAYTLVAREYTFNIPIAPNEEKVVEQWVHATGYGVSMRDREPVTVHGVAYFDTPDGIKNQIFNQELQQ